MWEEDQVGVGWEQTVSEVGRFHWGCLGTQTLGCPGQKGRMSLELGRKHRERR